MEQAGAAAVVLHSLFEEQIEAVAPEFRIDPARYLEHIAQAKRTIRVPIIASLNCTTLGGWISYARRITEAVEKFRAGGLLLVHAGGTAGLFSTVVGGWVSGSAGSQPVTKEVEA